jgi:hypothetical protein
MTTSDAVRIVPGLATHNSGPGQAKRMTCECGCQSGFLTCRTCLMPTGGRTGSWFECIERRPVLSSQVSTALNRHEDQDEVPMLVSTAALLQ